MISQKLGASGLNGGSFMHPNLWKAVQQVRAGETPDGYEYSEPVSTEPRCTVCRDSGWISKDLSPRISKLVECSACGIVAADRYARFAEIARIPSSLARSSWERYDELLELVDSTFVVEEMRAARDDLRAWAANRDDRTSAMLIGPFGTGKSSMAVCAAMDRCKLLGISPLFFAYPDLIEAIKDGFDSSAGIVRTTDTIEMVSTVPLLILDDLGAGIVTDWRQEQLYRIIGRRHDEERVTIFTTNCKETELKAAVGPRVYSRIIGMCGLNIWQVGSPDHDLRILQKLKAR